jgi:hypothetical protein
MLGNLVVKMTAQRHAEPGDLRPATRMARRPTNARICMSERCKWYKFRRTGLIE